MNLDKVSPGSVRGFSSNIKITLTVAERQFNVASVGPKHVILRDACRIEPCKAVLRLQIDEHVTEDVVELPNGIDPTVDRQPYVCVSKANGEIAA
jgi:hypothetical protein